jgi:hypothetical protein
MQEFSRFIQHSLIFLFNHNQRVLSNAGGELANVPEPPHGELPRHSRQPLFAELAHETQVFSTLLHRRNKIGRKSPPRPERSIQMLVDAERGYNLLQILFKINQKEIPDFLKLISD